MTLKSAVLTIGAVALLVAGGAARADLLLYEPFDYTAPAPLLGLGGTTEINLSGTYVSGGSLTAATVANSMVYPVGTFPAATSGQSVYMSGKSASQGDYSRSITTAFGDMDGASTIWISFMITPTYTAYNNSVRLNSATYGVGFGWGGGGGSGVGTWQAMQTAGTGGITTGNGGGVVAGTEVLLVGRIDFSGDTNPDTAYLFMNPGTTQPDVSTAVSTLTGANFGDMNKLSFHWGASALIDEIRVARTYNDLAGVVAESFHPGDINGDGLVDLQDFGTLKDNFGATEAATWATGDLTGDGAIDLQDFGVLKDHFGHTNGDTPVTAVPEPASLALLALGALAIRRRK